MPSARRALNEDDIRAARGLRRTRRERGLSFQAMADLINVSIGHLYRVEKFQRPWGMPLAATARSLGISVSDLLVDCKHCNYEPPDGYICDNCGTSWAENKVRANA